MIIKDLNSRAVFIRRLGYYAIGIALGLFALGFYEMARRSEMERMRKAAAVEATQTPSEQPPAK